jgi:hypothetical protein
MKKQQDDVGQYTYIDSPPLHFEDLCDELIDKEIVQNYEEGLDLIKRYNSGRTNQHGRIIKQSGHLTDAIVWLMDYMETQSQLINLIEGRITIQQLKRYIATQHKTLQKLLTQLKNDENLLDEIIQLTKNGSL